MALCSSNSIIWIFAITIFILSVQGYDSDLHDGDDNLLDDENDESRMVLTDEESALYDKDQDGTLNHKEMANYLQDVLDKKFDHKKKSTYSQSKLSALWTIFGSLTWAHKAIIVVLWIAPIILYWIISLGRNSQQSLGEVPVEDLRAARLRKLEIAQKQQISKTVDLLKIQPAQPTVTTPSDDGYDDFELCNDKRKTAPNSDSLMKEGVQQMEKVAKVITRPVVTKNTASLQTSSSLEHNIKLNTEKAINTSSELPNTEIKVSFEKVVERILSQVLDCSIEFVSLTSPNKPMGIPLSSNTSPAKLILQKEDIPTTIEEKSDKISKIVSKRMSIELEPMKCAIKCFDRCLRTTDATIKSRLDIWQAVTEIIKQDCADMVVQQLVKGVASPVTSVEEDLWSDLCTDSNHHQGLSVYFLECLAGWSSDGAVISSEFLVVLLEKAKDDALAKETFVDMITLLGRHVRSLPRIDEIALRCSSLFKGIEILVNQPIMIDFLSEALLREAKESSTLLGHFFQDKSMFSRFLSLSTLEAKVTGKSSASKPFISLQNFPRTSQSDIERVKSQIGDGFHFCQNVVYSILRKVLVKHQQSALAWIAAVLTDSDARSKVLLSASPDEAIACDGFMMNVCHVLLRLCEPFFVSKGESKIGDIATGYCLSEACRLNHDSERTLCGSCIDNEDRENATNFILPNELAGKFILKTEVFHLTKRALHIGLVNTIQHFNRLVRQYLVLKEMNEGKDNQVYIQRLLALFVFQWRTVLEDEQLMQLCCEFYLTSAVWLQKQLENCEQPTNEQELSDEEIEKNQRILLASIPEFYVKDMCTWFYYVTTNIPEVLRGLKIIHFVDCCAMVMSCKGNVPGPMVSSKIVSALLAFADSCSRKTRKDSLLETTSWGSGIEGCLTAAVVVSPVIREKLASAMIQTYTSVDVVEGLDVDKEEFDKFSSRSEVISLLQKLWKYPESRALFIKRCEENQIQEFLSAVLDSLLYLLNDGLSRLTNVSKLQKSLEDQSTWQELDPDEQEQKSTFLKNEEHVSKSFMSMANTTLTFLSMITQEPEVAQCFSRKPLSQRTASAIIGFLDTLCGPKRIELKVKNMEKYSFNPRDLLGKLGSVLLCIAKCDVDQSGCEFVRDLATDPDYCKSTVEHAIRTISRHDLIPADGVTELKAFIEKCEVLQQTVSEELSRDVVETEEKSDEGLDGQLEEIYETSLKDERYKTCQLLEVSAFHSFVAQPINQRSSKIRALMREITQLKDSLPIHVNSSIFVRQDEERMDFARTMITGPVDTPYSRGCFVFDVYFPCNYPNVPPLVKLITTGNGTVRFNPNLYADGKVCLSLLGTWHGGDSSEKWNPKTSSLYQVLLSIQGMILIPDPCFNEPGYEGIRGTHEGDELSRKYNATIRLATIRHAMLAQIRHPPSGLEEVIHAHFKLQKDVILRQVHDWLKQCQEPEEQRRMSRDIEELKIELGKL